MPQADVSVQFTGAPSSLNQTVNGTALNNSVAASAARAVPFVAPYTGVLTGGLVNLYAASTGNMKFALYDVTGTTLLATSNPIANPPINTATPFTFPTPPAIVKGQTYYLAHDQDSAINCNIASTGLAATLSTTLAYASFPPASLAGWTAGSANAAAMIVTFAGVSNSSLVCEAQQDSGATYVFDSNPGDADFYNIATIPFDAVERDRDRRARLHAEIRRRHPHRRRAAEVRVNHRRLADADPDQLRLAVGMADGLGRPEHRRGVDAQRGDQCTDRPDGRGVNLRT